MPCSHSNIKQTRQVRDCLERWLWWQSQRLNNQNTNTQIRQFHANTESKSNASKWWCLFRQEGQEEVMFKVEHPKYEPYVRELTLFLALSLLVGLIPAEVHWQTRLWFKCIPQSWHVGNLARNVLRDWACKGWLGGESKRWSHKWPDAIIVRVSLCHWCHCEGGLANLQSRLVTKAASSCFHSLLLLPPAAGWCRANSGSRVMLLGSRTVVSLCSS